MKVSQEFPVRVATQQSNSEFDEIFIAVNPTVVKLRKVFFLLSLQQFLSIVACIASVSYPQYFNQLPKLTLWVSEGILLICLLLGFISRPKVSRNPTNWTLYVVFLICYALATSIVVAERGIDYFLMALVGMFTQSFGQFIYMNTSKQELTFQGASVFIFGALIIQMQGFIIASQVTIMHIIIGAVFSIVWGFYLSFSNYIFVQSFWANMDVVDDYVSGAVFIYIEVPYMALDVVSMIGKSLFQT